MTITNKRVVPLAEIADLAVFDVNALYPLPPERLKSTTAAGKPVRKPDSITVREMADSLQEVGQIDAIALYRPPGSDKDVILDGKIRRAGAVLAGLETALVADFEGSVEAAHEYVLKMNTDRGSLSSDQRAVIAALYQELRPGDSFKDLAPRFLVPQHLVERAVWFLEQVKELEGQAEEAVEAVEVQRFVIGKQRDLLEAAGDQARIAEIVADLNAATEAFALAEERSQDLTAQAATKRQRLLRIRDGRAKL